MIKYCECGCGRIVKTRYAKCVPGHNFKGIVWQKRLSNEHPNIINYKEKMSKIKKQQWTEKYDELVKTIQIANKKPERCKKISESQKGRKAYWMKEFNAKKKGIPLVEKHKNKISISNTGKIRTQETKQKIKEGTQRSWDSGFHKINQWCKNLTKETDVRLKNMGAKISKTKQGVPSNKKGKSLLEQFKGDKNKVYETQKKRKLTLIKNNYKPKRYNTNIEIKVENKLKDLCILKYFNKKPVYKENKLIFPDFISNDFKIIIECDGDYWHGNPNKYSEKKLNKIQLFNKKNDEIKDKIYQKMGYKVLRFWETDINKNIDNIGVKIIENII
jgi:very-short-patch-repair endonuclease